MEKKITRTIRAIERLRHNRVKVASLYQRVGSRAALSPVWDSGHQPRQPERGDSEQNGHHHRQTIEILLDHR